MKRGFLRPSKKEPVDSLTIRNYTRKASIDILQETAIDKVNQNSIDSNTTPSIDTTCGETEMIEVLMPSIAERED